ncbi:MAG TPA: hypothetical protein VMM18_06440 [Gemmatimonadaceae bacterium]|nr:hypothetical protein [Gemmatimonadaceae bacterium]
MESLWSSTSTAAWRDALESYDRVIAAQGVTRLTELDRWYRDELAPALAGRRPPHVTLDELAAVAEWKMARGVWRARNLALVRGNDPDAVRERSAAALARIPDPDAPIAELAKLAGVGPATASAVAAAAAPAVYPFFDDLVAAQVPGLGAVSWTLPYYRRYAEALRDRAGRLGGEWTPVLVERALWADAGGKAGRRRAT